MSGGHPEKRSFLHSASDTDSDVDHEQGWADVGLANQLGRGLHGTSKQNSYVTHDFTVFRAAKLDPDRTEVVLGESKVLLSKEPADERGAEGISQRPIEASSPFIQGSPSGSRYRPLESTSQSEVSNSDPRGAEPSGTDCYIESGIKRSSSQSSPFGDKGPAVTETNVSIFSDIEKWPSLQFPFSSIGVLEDDSFGGGSNLKSSSEINSSGKVSHSEIGTVVEERGGRTSHSRDPERQLSVQSAFNEIDTPKEDGGRNSVSGSNRPVSAHSLYPDIDKFAEEVRWGQSNISGASARPSQATPPSEIDLLGKDTSGRISYINGGSERQSPLQSSVLEMESLWPTHAKPSSEIDLLGDDTSGKPSYISGDSERQLPVQSYVVEMESARSSDSKPPSEIDLLGDDTSRRPSYISGGSERKAPLQSSVVEMETFGEIDTLREDSGRTSVVDSDRPSVAQLLYSDIDKFAEQVRGGQSNVSSASARPSQAIPPSEIDVQGEDASGSINYINGDSERQSPLQSSVLEMETFGSRGGRTSHNLHEKWSLSDLNLLGDEGGKSNSIGSGNEGQSFSKSPLSDTETLGEEMCARHGHVGSSSERQPLPKPKVFDTDVRSDGVGSDVISAEGSETENDPLFHELRPGPPKELKMGPVISDRQAPLFHTVSVNDVDGDEVGGKGIDVVKGNERRPSGKERVLDEQSKPLTDSRRTSLVLGGNGRRPSGKELALDEKSQPLRDIKRASTISVGNDRRLDEQSEPLRDANRGSVVSGRRASRLPSTSDLNKDPESVSERTRGRGSLNQSSRRTSRIVSPPSEAESGVQGRERDDYGEVETPEFTPRQSSLQRRNSIAAQVGERVPPEWALLLLGCLLGLATGLSVVLFNKGVHFIHDMAWAGTPKDGAAWFRLQQLIDIWHRVLLLPVVGGVVVGMMHAVLGILDQIKASRPPQPRHTIDWLAGVKPTVKAGQAMVTLGTGCSLGPEGPSVDIGKAWANGLATIMKNNKERRIALVAAGAAAGISAGFNAPVSGMFFAIETVLRPQNAENSPPLTTAMIILASVISSTVSQILLVETPAFTVPTYELRSAAELPLYLLLGGLCGVVSVIFVRMTAYFTELFEFLRDQIGVPPTVTPALGGLVTGVIALKYPGVLYWGFYNVDEILHSGKSAIAPGAGLVTQLICAKVVATAFSKGSGLVGGVYAPSLFIGAAVGSVYGTIAGKIIDAALPGQNTVAHPQAYALVGMAALLAAVCSVPLTSVLLLFELTKDYHILLPLMGGIGVAIWVAAVAKQTTEKHFATSAPFGGRSFQPVGTDEEGVPDQIGRDQLVWRRTGSGTELELCTLDDYEGPDVVSDAELKDSIKVSQAMSKTFVKVQAIATVKETIGQILSTQQRCALVVDENDLLEGIFTFSDLQREALRAAEDSYTGHRTVVDVDKMLVASICSGKGDNQGQDTDLVVCFPDMSLRAVTEIMDSSGFKQLPVVARAGKRWQDEGRHVIGLMDRDAVPRCVREEALKRMAAILAKDDEDDDGPLLDGH